jgi:hypothetical protein
MSQVGPSPGTSALIEFLSGPSAGSPKALVQLLPALRKQLDAAEGRARQALAEVEGLRQVIAGVEAIETGVDVQPQLFLDDLALSDARVTDVDTPRGQEAVLKIIEEHPERIWTTPQLRAEVIRRRWIRADAARPDAAVRLAARRLAAQGKIEKVGDGRYRARRDTG